MMSAKVRLSKSALEGEWLKLTYVFSGTCFWREAVLMAVMICRVTHSSAKLRKVVLRPYS